MNQNECKINYFDMDQDQCHVNMDNVECTGLYHGTQPSQWAPGKITESILCSFWERVHIRYKGLTSFLVSIISFKNIDS